MDEENDVRDYLAAELGGQIDLDHFAPPWAANDMGDDASYIIRTVANSVFTDAGTVGQTVMLSMLNVKHRGVGFGTRVMEVFAKFAKERGYAVQVNDVRNPGFFDKIPWLDDNYRSTFGPPDPFYDED